MLEKSPVWCLPSSWCMKSSFIFSWIIILMETLSIDIHNFSKVLFKFGSETECFLVFFCSKSGVKAPEYDDWRVYSLRMLQQHWHLPWNAWGCSPNIMALDKKKKEKTSLGTSSITSLSPLSLSLSLSLSVSLSLIVHILISNNTCVMFLLHFFFPLPVLILLHFLFFYVLMKKSRICFQTTTGVLYPSLSSFLSHLLYSVLCVTELWFLPATLFPPLSLSLSLSLSPLASSTKTTYVSYNNHAIWNNQTRKWWRGRERDEKREWERERERERDWEDDFIGDGAVQNGREPLLSVGCTGLASQGSQWKIPSMRHFVLSLFLIETKDHGEEERPTNWETANKCACFPALHSPLV